MELWKIKLRALARDFLVISTFYDSMSSDCDLSHTRALQETQGW